MQKRLYSAELMAEWKSGEEMNPNSKAERVRLHSQIALEHLRIRPEVIVRIRELHGGGLEDFEIAKHTQAPMATVQLVLRCALP